MPRQTVQVRPGPELRSAIADFVQRGLYGAATNVFRESVFTLYEGTVDDEPVVTSQLANSFVIARNEVGRSPSPPVLDLAVMEGKSRAYQQARLLVLGDVACITTTCPYAGFVENGTARMRGNHVIATNARRWPGIVRRSLATVKQRGGGW